MSTPTTPASINSPTLGEVILPRHYSAQDRAEFQAAGDALKKNCFDVYSEEGTDKNTALLFEFFEKHRELPVTTINIYRAINERRSEFAWLTVAQHQWYELAKTNPEFAQQVVDQVKNFRLVIDGESGYVNFALVFNELVRQGAQPTWTAVRDAVDRISHRPGARLVFTEEPRKEHYSEASKEYDGKNSFGIEGLTKQRDGSYGKSAADYAREAREAQLAQQQSQDQQRAERNRVKDEWEIICETLAKNGTHSQQADSTAAIKQGIAAGKSFRQIHADLQNVAFQHSKFKSRG